MFEVRSETELSRVDAAIHDGWFSVQDVQFNESTCEFSILFTHDESSEFRVLRRSLSSLRGRRAGRLVVRCTETWDYKDTERVTWYDLNRLRYRRKRRRLEILTTIPLWISLQVTELDVVVYPCGESGRPVPCVAL